MHSQTLSMLMAGAAVQAYRPVVQEVFLREAGGAAADAKAVAAPPAADAEAEEGELEEGEAMEEGEAAVLPAASAALSTPLPACPSSSASCRGEGACHSLMRE